MALKQILPDRVDIKRPTTTKSSSKRPIRKPCIHLTNVKCNIQAVIGNENVQGGRKYSKPEFKIYFEPEIDITLKDIVVYNGEDYNIIETDSWPGAYTKFFLEKTN